MSVRNLYPCVSYSELFSVALPLCARSPRQEQYPAKDGNGLTKKARTTYIDYTIRLVWTNAFKFLLYALQ